MNCDEFFKLANYTLKLYHVTLDKREDFIQDLWLIYQNISKEKSSYIIQRFKWFILDNFRKEKKDGSYLIKQELADWMWFTSPKTKLIWQDLVLILTVKECRVVRLLVIGYTGNEIAKALKISPAAVSKMRKKIQDKIRAAKL